MNSMLHFAVMTPYIPAMLCGLVHFFCGFYGLERTSLPISLMVASLVLGIHTAYTGLTNRRWKKTNYLGKLPHHTPKIWCNRNDMNHNKNVCNFYGIYSMSMKVEGWGQSVCVQNVVISASRLNQDGNNHTNDNCDQNLFYENINFL